MLLLVLRMCVAASVEDVYVTACVEDVCCC